MIGNPGHTTKLDAPLPSTPNQAARPLAIKQHLPALSWLPSYSRNSWRGDWHAGLTVGVMLIPQGMAYAMIAGLPVVYGLYAALIPQVVYAFLGTSRHLAVGPVAMDSLLVAAGLTGMAAVGSENYIALALMLALMMGLLQLGMGCLGLGFIVNFLSRPAISGFTSAAALIIGLNQLPQLLGVSCARNNQIHVLLSNVVDVWTSMHAPTILIGLSAILGFFVLKTWAPKWPAALLIVGAGTLTSWLLGFESRGIQVVGIIPDGLPALTIPSWNIGQAKALFPTALTLSLVAFMEAFSVAKAIEERHDYTVDANQELRALGLANILGSLFQSYPTTGGFSRTAVTEEAGGKTPVVSWIAAGVVGLTLVAFTPLFYNLPNGILAAIVMVAVVGLMDLRYPAVLWKQDRIEAGILAVTFVVTLTASMPMGIGVGMFLGLAMAVQKMMSPHVAVLGNVAGVFRNVDRFPDAQTEIDVLVVRYDGALNFANQAHFKSSLNRLIREKGPKLRLVVLQADTLSYVDASAQATLRSMVMAWKSQGITLCLAGAIGPVRDVLAADGLLATGSPSFQLDIHDALQEHRHPGTVSPLHQSIAQQHS